MVEEERREEVKEVVTLATIASALKAGDAQLELVPTGQTGETWKHFVFARYNGQLFNEKCFCKYCYSHFQMRNSRGNS